MATIKCYTLKDVSSLTNTPVPKLRKHIKEGLLRVSKMGRLLIVTEEALAEYVEKIEEMSAAFYQKVVDGQDGEIRKLQAANYYYKSREQFAKDPGDRYEEAVKWKWLLEPLQKRLNEHVSDYENGWSKLKIFSVDHNIKDIKRECERDGDFDSFAGYEVGYAPALNRWLIERNPGYEGIYLRKRASKMDYKFGKDDVA